MTKIFLICAVALGLAGCVTESIHPAGGQLPASCKLVRTVHGAGAGSGEEALQAAKSDAYRKALAAGATHVIYVGSAQSSRGANADAEAYRCR